MAFRKIHRPDKSEYPEYSKHYFDLIQTDTDILQELHDNFFKLRAFIQTLTEEQLQYRYAEGKWTIREILVHNIDDERIYTYRAIRYARHDSTPLNSFDQDEYVKYSDANDRSLENIFEEYWAVRLSTLLLFQNLPEAAFLRTGSNREPDGTVNNTRTVRALAYHIAGHELSHVKVILERYLHLPPTQLVLP